MKCEFFHPALHPRKKKRTPTHERNSFLSLAIIYRQNVSLGKREVWLMRTGAHTVREIRCLRCDAYLGWKILRAHELPERWKNGSFVLEREFLLLHSVYEDEEPSAYMSLSLGNPTLKLKAIGDLHRRNKPLPLRPLPSPIPAQ